VCVRVCVTLCSPLRSNLVTSFLHNASGTSRSSTSAYCIHGFENVASRRYFSRGSLGSHCQPLLREAEAASAAAARSQELSDSVSSTLTSVSDVHSALQPSGC